MIRRTFLVFAAVGISVSPLRGQDVVPTPAAQTKLAIGADRVLADWSQITAYFDVLARSTAAIRVDTLGPTTEKRPMIVATISTPENIRRLDEIRGVQRVLADPRQLSGDAEARAIASQPTVLVISCNIHASEIASSQMAMELAYRLATNDTLQRHLRNVVVLLVPSMNPDGQDMITKWYRQGVATKWEGGPLPWLYHHYVGHDNNRDWYMMTQQETRLVTDFLYRRWFPEIFYDVHQQGANGMRLTVPPHIDPIDPNVDPLIVRGITQIGARMSWALESRGKTGVGDRQTYDLWWHGGARSAPTRHNMIGLLTEAASAKIATPITLAPGDLRGLPKRPAVNYPNPWPGGTWRLRDIMDYELIAAEALVKLADEQREDYVRNFVALGKKAIAAGAAGKPYGYRISMGRDPEASRKLLEVLRLGGVEMGTIAGQRDVFINLAQPYRAHVKDLLEVQSFPKIEQYPGGPVQRPYDVAGWTLPMQMGVAVTPIDTPMTAKLTYLSSLAPDFPALGCPAAGSGRYTALDASDTRSYGLVAQALAANRTVSIAGSGSGARFVTELPTGASVSGCALRRVASRPAGAPAISRLPRIALYKSWTASMDEGWTRFVLERESIPFVSIGDSIVKGGKLRDLYDVILVPDMSFREIRDGMAASQVPPRYAGGLGEAGVAELAAFVRAGGSLVLLDRSSELATSALGVGVTRITVAPRQDDDAEDEGGKGKRVSLYAPGSILRILVDGTHPLARGMGDTAAVYFTNSVTFDVPAGSPARVIARYPAKEDDILLSGYLQGGDAIAGKAAAVEVPVGSGRVVMFGFRPQYRGQSYGTFKMLFNALLAGGTSTTRR
jgi:hypothetical protein